MAIKFGKGGVNSSSIGEQLNDKFWSKVAVREAKYDVVFSQMGNKLVQPKHFGDTIKKYHELPIIHPANVNDQGIDGNGVKMVAGKWYAYDANGARIDEYDTLADAKSGAGATGTVKSGNGNLYGSSKDFAVQNGSFPALREEGGKVNAVGMKREVLEAKVKEYGFAIPFTKKALEMDTETGLFKRLSMEAGEAYGRTRETQVRNGLISAGLNNVVYTGAATSMDTMDKKSQLSYKTLRLLEKALKDARVPSQTKLIDGSTKFGTTTVPNAYYLYVGAELKPLLEDMVVSIGGNNVRVWNDVSEYAAAGNIAKGEIGRIGRFRFIEIEEMPSWPGAGDDSSQTDGGDNDGTGYYETDDHFDVFPFLFVGTDSFATVGFEGDVARVQTALPKVDANADWYGKNGVVSISWYFGQLVYRPERIRTILSVGSLG